MSDASQKHVLVVDDEDDIRAYLAMALEDAGFRVTEAVDGLDGMEKVKAETPDLISLDLVMPKHSGAKMY
ncbi:response regulator, partial [bacterium]|nr:response regulator [bacterium]